MPRKKAAAAAVSGEIAPAASSPVSCPACKSRISADGKTLHEKSGYLEELLDTAGVDELEKNIAAQEKKLAERDATIADLRSKLEEKSKAAAPAPQRETTANVGKQEQKRKPGWWD
jgi:hypothetical protein